MLDEKSCGAIIYLKTSEILYLLLHYTSGHWDFVKGNVETNETEKETVVRELKEETGITDASFVGEFKEKIEYFYRRRQGETVHKEVIFYLMETNTETVVLSFEHVDSIWLNYSQAMEKLTYKSAKTLLEKAHLFLNKKTGNSI